VRYLCRRFPGALEGGGVDEAQVRGRPPNQLCPLQRRLERLPGWVGVPGQTWPGHSEVKGQPWKRLHQGLKAGEHWPSVFSRAVLILAQAGLS
jgi:hypothetical protein